VDKEIYPFGVVPVENSIEGPVNTTLDLFWESEVQICAEIYQTISHDLLSTAKALEDIAVLYSHSQAFAQCREWIARNFPNCRLEPCDSTALAAQKALENPKSGAIAGREAARIYQLPIAASRIEDSIRNTTRFLVIGKKMPGRTKQDKTSLLFATHHVPGALYKVLKPINDAGLNMVKLESRPSRHENWSYHFFVDIEGHIEDAPVQQAVDEMNEMCMMLKCLGSYPRA
jgi:chorismate mutase/prephenate dehydratase